MKNSSFQLIFNICIILSTTSLVIGCKKDTPSDNSVNYQFPINDLAFVQYTPGKYFIYRDSVTNNTDSVVVTQSSIVPLSHTSTGNFDFSYTAQYYTFTLTQIDPGSNTTWLSGNGSSFLNSCTLYSVKPGFLLYINYGVYIPSMVVEGKTYTNVNLTSEGGVAHYYWAQGIGLIKRTETINRVTTTYTLLRHN